MLLHMPSSAAANAPTGCQRRTFSRRASALKTHPTGSGSVSEGRLRSRKVTGVNRPWSNVQVHKPETALG